MCVYMCVSKCREKEYHCLFESEHALASVDLKANHTKQDEQRYHLEKPRDNDQSHGMSEV